MWNKTKHDLSGDTAVLDLEALWKVAEIAYFGRLYRIDKVISDLKNLDQLANETERRHSGVSRDMLTQELDSLTEALVVASETLHVLSEARKNRPNIKITNHAMESVQSIAGTVRL